MLSDNFEDVLHTFVHELIDKNQLFGERYGKHKRWDWDAETALTITFSDPDKVPLRIVCGGRRDH